MDGGVSEITKSRDLNKILEIIDKEGLKSLNLKQV